MRLRFHVEEMEMWCSLRTPFLYPDNTPITLFVSESSANKVLISDHGEASDYAFVNGVGSGTLNNRLKKVGRRFGLHADGDELMIESSDDHVADAILSMVNAVQDVGYLVYRQSVPNRQRVFRSEIERFLVQKNRPYERDFVMRGKSRARKIDYRITGDGYKQLLLWVLDPSNERVASDRADSIAMSYIDVSSEISADSIAMSYIDVSSEISFEGREFAVIVNTQQHELSNKSLKGAVNILRNHGLRVIPWESRHEVDFLLAA